MAPEADPAVVGVGRRVVAAARFKAVATAATPARSDARREPPAPTVREARPSMAPGRWCTCVECFEADLPMTDKPPPWPLPPPPPPDAHEPSPTGSRLSMAMGLTRGLCAASKSDSVDECMGDEVESLARVMVDATVP